jgi:hypothetical protein
MTTTDDCITSLFCQVDDQMHSLPTHAHATLWPSDIGTLGLLHALKGVGNRAFYRWLMRDYRPLLPRLPERTTLRPWRTALCAPSPLLCLSRWGHSRRPCAAPW